MGLGSGVRSPESGVQIHPEPWDASILGIATGKLSFDEVDDLSVAVLVEQLEAALSHARVLGLTYLTTRIHHPRQATALERVGFKSLGPFVTLELRKLPSDQPVHDSLHIRKAVVTDTERLLQIAEQSPPPGRFHQDPTIPQHKADQIYVAWTQNAMTQHLQELSLSHPGSVIWVAELGQEMVGFAIAKASSSHTEDNPTAILDLIAVPPSHRQKGVGSALLHAVISSCQQAQYTTLQASTQRRNHPALRMYQKAGFIPKSEQTTYRWTELDISS